MVGDRHHGLSVSALEEGMSWTIRHRSLGVGSIYRQIGARCTASVRAVPGRKTGVALTRSALSTLNSGIHEGENNAGQRGWEGPLAGYS